MNLHVARLLTDAIIANLTDHGLVVGDGERPKTGAGWAATPGQSAFRGYVVVHSLAGGITDGTIEDPDDDAFPIYQLSTYGTTRAQCELLSDTCRDVMLGVPITLDGRTVAQVRVDMLGGARRDDAIQPPIWQGVERYRIVSTPAELAPS